MIVLSLAVLVGGWLLMQRYASHREAAGPAPAESANDGGVVEDRDGALSSADMLSPHEREEAAKDELARARAALAEGDLTTASSALDEASALDPSNPDIEELRVRLESTDRDGGL
jgi:hypothetical protein